MTNIISSANSLLGILNDVLDFSKIDANKLEFIEGPYDLAELISSVSNVVSLKADDKRLLMVVDAAPDLPKTLNGDDVRHNRCSSTYFPTQSNTPTKALSG